MKTIKLKNTKDSNNHNLLKAFLFLGGIFLLIQAIYLPIGLDNLEVKNGKLQSISCHDYTARHGRHKTACDICVSNECFYVRPMQNIVDFSLNSGNEVTIYIKHRVFLKKPENNYKIYKATIKYQNGFTKEILEFSPLLAWLEKIFLFVVAIFFLKLSIKKNKFS